MRDVQTGAFLHGHKLLDLIGQGHYGEVWRAEYMGHPVALKIFKGPRKPSEIQRETFAQHALGRLEGEEGRFFPRVEHLDLEADPPYLRMEMLDGTPIESLSSLPLEERLAIGEKVLEALAVVHKHGFVHGDLSPLNVLVTADRSVRLIDVGYGALFEDAGDIEMSTTPEEAPMGVASPLYSAPERFKGPGTDGCGKPSDVFSFGKLIYRMITGGAPFVIKPVSRKFPALGEAWDAFIYKCLEEQPAGRFADAAAALAEYRRIHRPALAPGEYRAECPECKAAQSIPGGWAGERFECRGCARTLEVLFYDDPSRYATSAVVPPGEPTPEIQFMEGGTDARAKKFCPGCGGKIKAEARKCHHCGTWVDEAAREIVKRETEGRAKPPATPRSYYFPALISFFAYGLFWVPGALLNWYFLEDARRERREKGETPGGMLPLQILMALFVYLPLLTLASVVVLGVILTTFARMAHF